MKAPVLLSALFLLFAGAAPATAQPTVYRCGNEYTRAPCSEGRVIDTQNSATTAARRAEAARVLTSEKRLAEDMARDRRLAEASIKPAMAGSLGPHKVAAADAKPASKPAPKKKKKSRATPRSGADDSADDFVAQVPKAKKQP
jgi:hypothetical protein